MSWTDKGGSPPPKMDAIPYSVIAAHNTSNNWERTRHSERERDRNKETETERSTEKQLAAQVFKKLNSTRHAQFVTVLILDLIFLHWLNTKSYIDIITLKLAYLSLNEHKLRKMEIGSSIGMQAWNLLYLFYFKYQDFSRFSAPVQNLLFFLCPPHTVYFPHSSSLDC